MPNDRELSWIDEQIAWCESQMPEDELMSLQMIKWFEEFGDPNGHRTYRLSIAEMKQLCVTARTAHALERKLIDALDSNKMLREEIDGINERYGAEEENELMSLEGINSIEARFDLNVPIAIVQMNGLIKTARAAHALEQKLVDILEDNNNLDHSNKTLRESLDALKQDWAKLKEEVRIAIERPSPIQKATCRKILASLGILERF